MVQPGIGGLDTPQTNAGDATYLSRRPDFDMSPEASFQSPSRDANVLQQLRNGARPSLRTPRGSRAPLTDRRNLPAGLGGPEFTPLLKSATRNSSRRHGTGKENGRATPAFLAKIDEDLTPMPAGETSVYGAFRNASSLMENTPLPVVDSSSVASTPSVMRRRGAGNGPLEDGKQLSLREQEIFINKIERENFGLKLKIHFLEEALRKSGPGFSDEALKENTELKVDRVTLQRELQRYKKHLGSAEKDLESYRQQVLEMQEKAKQRLADNQSAEIERLRHELEDKEARYQKHLGAAENDLESYKQQILELQENAREKEHEEDDQGAEIERLRDELQDKEAEIRSLQRQIDDHEDQRDNLEELLEKIGDLESAGESQGAEIEQLRQELQDKEAEINNLQRQVEGQVGEHAKMEELWDKIGVLESVNENKDTEIEQLQQELQERESELNRLQQKIESQEDKNNQVEKLWDEIGDLEADGRRKDDIITQQEEEIEALREKAAEAEKLLETRQRHVVELEGKINDSNRLQRTDIERLRQQLQEKEAQIDSLQRQIRSYGNQRDKEEDLWDKIRDLESDHRRKDAVITQQKNEIEALRDEVGEAKEQVKKTRKQAVELEEQVHDGERLQRANIKQLQQELQDKEAEIQSLRRRIESQAADHDKAVERLRAEIGDRLQHIERLQQELRHKEAEIENLQRRIKSQADEHNDALEKLRLEGGDRPQRTDIERLQQQLRQKEAALQNLQRQSESQGDEHERAVKKLRLDIGDLEHKLRRKDDVIRQQEDEIDVLRQKVEEAEEQYKASSRQLQNCLDEIEVLSEKAGETEGQREASARQLQERLDEIEALRKKVEEAEEQRKASVRQLQERLSELEDENIVLEQALEESRTAAEESAATHEEKLKKYEAKLEKYKRERDELAATIRQQQNSNSNHSGVSEMSLEERRDLHNMLRESQLAADRLDRELREHREALEELMGVESSLRKKLDRARSERAAYRASAEKLQKDFKELKAEKDKALADAANEERALVRAPKSSMKNGVDTDAIIRAAEAAERRHEKEIRGMAMQMEWLKACWDREAKLRSDAAFAKQYLMMEVRIRDAWYVHAVLQFPTNPPWRAP